MSQEQKELLTENKKHFSSICANNKDTERLYLWCWTVLFLAFNEFGTKLFGLYS